MLAPNAHMWTTVSRMPAELAHRRHALRTLQHAALSGAKTHTWAPRSAALRASQRRRSHTTSSARPSLAPTPSQRRRPKRIRAPATAPASTARSARRAASSSLTSAFVSAPSLPRSRGLTTQAPSKPTSSNACFKPRRIISSSWPPKPTTSNMGCADLCGAAAATAMRPAHAAVPSSGNHLLGRSAGFSPDATQG